MDGLLVAERVNSRGGASRRAENSVADSRLSSGADGVPRVISGNYERNSHRKIDYLIAGGWVL
jgi:hypothetical protein